jgi:hypothetical protein
VHDDGVDLILPIAYILNHALEFWPAVVCCGGSGFNKLGSDGDSVSIAPISRLAPLIWN